MQALKGVCQEIFNLYFFHDSNLPGLNNFEFGFNYAEIFKFLQNFAMGMPRRSKNAHIKNRGKKSRDQLPLKKMKALFTNYAAF